MMRILMIRRAERFSPNSVDKDQAILEAVAERLRHLGHKVSVISESDLRDDTQRLSVDPQCIFTMSRSPECLAWLGTLCGVRIINAPAGIGNCARSRLHAIMTRIGTPIPPADGPDGYWLKRGDAAAQHPNDVVFVKDRSALDTAIRSMQQRGITDYLVSAHVVGDLVKFYGVLGTGFFHVCYPTDEGRSKFGMEAHNGPARHYPFSCEALQQEAERLAAAVGIEVYGGDCIVKSDGSFCFIDFNDWPSFSPCREQAADAIASII